MTTRNLKPWPKGVSGNPGGRVKLPEELKAIHSLTQLEVCKLVSKYARMSRDELQAQLQSAKTPMLEITIASIFAQSAKNGDYARLSFLLDRAIGKVPMTQVELDEETAARQELKELSTAELVQLVKAKLPDLEAG